MNRLFTKIFKLLDVKEVNFYNENTRHFTHDGYDVFIEIKPVRKMRGKAKA